MKFEFVPLTVFRYPFISFLDKQINSNNSETTRSNIDTLKCPENLARINRDFIRKNKQSYCHKKMFKRKNK